MRLFICHVAEDKDEFVRPLAEALREHFEVWYDEFQLTIGDNLLEKIDEGLRTSDFAVVVLSKQFFGKKRWAAAELNGLFAKEVDTGKIILPVWYGVTEDEVRQYSTILAGKLAVNAEEGLSNVVKAIRLAVETSSRQRQLTILESASERMKGLDETLSDRRDSERLLSNESGARLVNEAKDVVFDSTEQVLSELSATSNVLKFRCKRGNRFSFNADTGFNLTLHMNLRGLVDNSAASAKFTICVFSQPDRLENKFDILDEEEFAPSFRRNQQVVWKSKTTSRTFPNEQLTDRAIEMLRAQIERAGIPH
jgi:TIR domain